MTQASIETYHHWDTSKRVSVQKRILSYLCDNMPSTYGPIFAATGLRYNTGSARVQELRDSGLVTVIGQRDVKERATTRSRSIFSLSPFGEWLMAQDNREEILRRINASRLELEQERADRMRHIHREHVAQAKADAQSVARGFGYA